MRRIKKIGLLCLVLALLIFPGQALAASNPAVPTALKAVVISSSQINLSWEPVSSAAQYYIYRANSSSGTYTYIGASDTPSYISAGLKANTRYYYKVQAITNSGSSDYSAEAWAVTHSESGRIAPVENNRLSGSDRYTTAAEIAEAGWNTSSYAIIAGGENFPDAICASPLAAKYKAPILLTPKNSLHVETKKQLLALDVKDAIIIGGTAVVSEKAADAIRDLGIKVTRLAGVDRYETSLKVAEAIGDFDEAVIASGLNFQDVLSIAPIAAKEGMPILLTPKDSLGSDLKKLLDRHCENTYVLGDSGSISNNVYRQLPSPQRLTGTNWYDMNINIIEFFRDRLDLHTCYLTTGAAYPDALTGSALASLQGSPVILVGSSLTKDAAAFFQDYSSAIQNVVAFGGAEAVSEKLLDTISSEIGTVTTSNQLITNLSATPQSASQIYLTWNKVNDAVAYHVYRSSSFSGTYTKITATTTPYYFDTYLSTGTTYYYKVQAVYNGETGPYSDAVPATTLTTSAVLMQPTNVKAEIRDTNQVYLTWDVVSSALHYNVYRATSPTGSYTKLVSVSTPFYTDLNLASGITYYYKIQAVNNTSSSLYSNSVQAQTWLDHNVLTAATNVSATGLSPSQIHVKWDAVDNATFYHVYRSTSLTGAYDLVATVGSPFHVDTNLTSGTAYFYKIQSGNTVGVGYYSEAAYASTMYGFSTLGVPGNIKATPLSSEQIFLTWDSVANASYYNIYRAASSTGAYNLVGTTDSPHFTDTHLTTQTTYYYKIQPCNSTTTGDRSGPVSGTTK
ncbi:cell wall-binding protein [Desulfitobacterium dehalogenans ATCC 51507]|uniref:Cell wall-binding protein n=1 Tax=Desulfitobacterium dehalogenans (strain ATCC 51507 / DSM 9161 / JW/IU-DC1) TaxID=756499 RepID=I4ADT1_DESDJ|nr:cell wall-binding repeat-containing protein [Desulfitobacterium dehalogenans]AFM02116.1 cell wall-binding protein [Desulfitobacterium dehalogenans ATCC 51507]